MRNTLVINVAKKYTIQVITNVSTGSDYCNVYLKKITQYTLLH